MDHTTHARELLMLLGAEEVPGPVRSLFRALLHMGAHGDNVCVVAGVTGVPRHRIRRTLKAHGLPHASRVVRWGRILHAMEIYRGSTSLEAAAWLIGSEPSSISRMMIESAGVRPGEWKRGGGCLENLKRLLVDRWQGVTA